MPEHPFLRAIKKRLYPLLRAEGFSGGGTTLRRNAPPIVHVFNVQSCANHCYLNLGAHLDFLPTAGEGRCDPESLNEYQCVFRGRIEPPNGPTFGWAYLEDEGEAKEMLDFIESEWQCVGRRFFGKYSRFPDDFAALVTEGVATSPPPGHALVLARIALHLDWKADAVTLATVAMASAPPTATLLKRSLEVVRNAAVARR